MCTYVKGADWSTGGGRIGRVRDGWPEPLSPRVVAAQEVRLGLLRRLIPRPGHARRLPGALGARRKLFSEWVGRLWSHIGLRSAQSAAVLRTWKARWPILRATVSRVRPRSQRLTVLL